MPELVEKYMAGKLMLDEFISWRYPLDQINKGLEHLEKGEGFVLASAGDSVK
jgi:S-(hydroxymethyl)glutathione dehydrogenase/alcohol dehydrogenase